MESESTTLAPDENGNFSSPALDALLGVWDDYDAERVEHDEVLRVVSRVEAFVSEKLQTMEAEAVSPKVDPHDPNRVAILTAFQNHLVALKSMRDSFANDDFELVDEAFEILQNATNQMVLGLSGLIEDDARYAPILCVRCAKENQKTSNNCVHCGAILPKIAQPNEKQVLAVAEIDRGQESDGETTPNYIEVAEAHESWSQKTLSDEQFYQVLSTVRERHVGQHTLVCELLAKAQDSGDDPADLEHLAEILEQNVNALDEMLEGLEETDDEAVEQGLNALAGATLLLIKAEKQNAPAAETD